MYRTTAHSFALSSSVPRRKFGLARASWPPLPLSGLWSTFWADLLGHDVQTANSTKKGAGSASGNDF